MEIPNWSVLEPVLQWLGVLSLCTFIVSLAIIPWLVGRLPEDFFIRHPGVVKRLSLSSGIGTLFWFGLRNLAGALLFLAGIAMLFLPGQGILTIIIGLSLMSFPGKHRLLLALTAKPSVQRGLDWLRAKTGHRAFIWPAKHPEPPSIGRPLDTP